MADYGWKVSRAGVDVKSAGLKDLLFHSGYPMLKEKASGSGSFTMEINGAGADVLLYTHSLGYNPLFMVYARYYDVWSSAVTTNYYRMPIAGGSAGGVYYYNFTPYVNTTQLRFTCDALDGGSPADVTIYYYYFVWYEPE